MADVIGIDGKPHESGEMLANGGRGPHDPGMEARVAKLESAVEHIQTDIAEIKTDIREVKRDARADFRVTWAGLIALGLGLAGLLAKGFHWL